MNVLPVGLLIDRRLCVVVGGGPVAARKAAALAEAGGQVRAVAPQFTTDFETLEGVEKIEATYQSAHVEGAAVVIAATDERETNLRAARDARAAGALVNVVDAPEECDFIFPAVSRKGDVAVAVSTGGASPTLARRLREHIDGTLRDSYAELAWVLKSLRKRAIAELPSAPQRSAFFEGLASDEFLAFIEARGREAALEEASRRLDEAIARAREESRV